MSASDSRARQSKRGSLARPSGAPTGRVLDAAHVEGEAANTPLDTAPTCKGFGMHHKVKSMVCIGLEDDGAVIWRCPKCLYVWSANADRPDTVGQA